MAGNEFSELQAFDFALGAHIIGAFAGVNNTVGPKQWQEFLSRPPGKQVWRTEADDPKAMLSELSTSGKNQTLVAGKISNLPSLPLVYYFRKPGFTNGDNKNFVIDKKLWCDALLKQYNLSILPIVLDYTMVFASWDKPTLDKMQLAWYAYIVKSNRFYVPYQVGTAVVEVAGWMSDPTTILFSDASVALAGDSRRIYATSCLVEVVSQVVSGADVDVPIKVATLEGVFAGYSCCNQTYTKEDGTTVPSTCG